MPRPLRLPRRLLASLPALILGAGLLALAACGPTTKDRIALVGVNVFTGGDGAILRDQVIVVRGTRIDTIAPREGFKIPRTAEVVDLTGKWVIPGLIDAHGHAERWALDRYLAFGVTAVRDLGGPHDSTLALAQEVALGSIRAPRLFVAGSVLDGPTSADNDAVLLATPDEARRAVDQRVSADLPVVMAYTRITAPLLRAIVEEATTFKMPVAAQLGLVDAVTAARTGVRSIEHLSGIPEAIGPAEPYYAAHRRSHYEGWTKTETAWGTLDSAAIARVAAELAAIGVTMVPTLVLHETWSRLDDPAITGDQDLAYVPARAKEAWSLPDFIAGVGWDARSFTAFRSGRPKQDLFLREFLTAGGNVVAGTDASRPMVIPGASLHTELRLLVAAGLPARSALQAATSRAAALIGADSIGMLAPRKVADLLVLDADPVANITNTRRITHVMIRGLLIPRDSLEQAARQ
jgi:imidazolonepropionase-like amidohydrolase